MRIVINNIGHVEKADIEFNSITVIAGNNNTGKSTVGKALYATATGLNLLEPYKILEEKADAVSQKLHIITRLVELDQDDEESLNEIRMYCVAREYLKEFEESVEDNLFLSKDYSKELDDYFSAKVLIKISTLFDRLLSKTVSSRTVVLQDVRTEVVILLQKSINDKNFKVNIMQKVFNMEFFKQISHLNELERESNITVKELNQNEININFKEHQIQGDKSELDISRTFSKALYIDNPFVLDNNPMIRFMRQRNQYAHTQVLRRILSDQDSLQKDNLFELDNREERIEEIFQYIMHQGKVVWKDGNHYFENAFIKSPLYFENLSTGLKSFSIINMLLKSNSLDECEYIILDEPEIHLHPDWQLKFAELLVLISKTFKLKLIITSHSPYFIEAIELYSKKHNYFSDTRFYITKRNNNNQRYIIENVTDNVKKLYDDLANAFYSLEELRNQIEEDSDDD